jgi:hypothetical protein
LEHGIGEDFEKDFGSSELCDGFLIGEDWVKDIFDNVGDKTIAIFLSDIFTLFDSEGFEEGICNSDGDFVIGKDRKQFEKECKYLLIGENCIDLIFNIQRFLVV